MKYFSLINYSINKLSSQAFWGAASQILLSLTNFGVSIFLIRYATKEQFGIYGIIFAVSLFSMGIGNALIGTQMTVNVAGKSKSEQKLHAAEMLLYLTLVNILFAFIVFAINKISILSSAVDVYLFLAIIVGITGAIFYDFFRSYYYLCNRPKKVVLIDIFTLLFLGYILFLCLNNESQELHSDAILYRGIISYVIIFAIILFEKLPIYRAMSSCFRAIQSSLRNGSWALLGSVVINLQNQSIVYFVGYILGATAVADMNAARLLLAPLSMLSAGIYRSLFPTFAALANKNRLDEVKKLGKLTVLSLLVITLFYFAGLYIFEDFVIAMLGGDKYVFFSSITLLWAIYFVACVFRNYPSLVYQSKKLFKELTAITVRLSVPAVILVMLGIFYFSIEGGIIAMIAAEILLFVFLLKGKNKNFNNI